MSITKQTFLTISYKSLANDSKLPTYTARVIEALRQMAADIEARTKQDFVIWDNPFLDFEVSMIHVDPAIYNKSVDTLRGLSVRAYNGVRNAGAQTIGELVKKSSNELLKTKNFGPECLSEVTRELGKLGLCLIEDTPR